METASSRSSTPVPPSLHNSDRCRALLASCLAPTASGTRRRFSQAASYPHAFDADPEPVNRRGVLIAVRTVTTRANHFPAHRHVFAAGDADCVAGVAHALLAAGINEWQLRC